MFSKKHFVKINEHEHPNGLFVLGVVRAKKDEKLILSYKHLEKEVKFVSDKNELDYEEKVKEIKSCKHKNHPIETLEFQSRYEQLKYYNYCGNCGKVKNEYEVKTENTSILIDIRYSENQLKSAEERIESHKKSISYYEQQKEKYIKQIEELKKQLK